MTAAPLWSGTMPGRGTFDSKTSPMVEGIKSPFFILPLGLHRWMSRKSVVSGRIDLFAAIDDGWLQLAACAQRRRNLVICHEALHQRSINAARFATCNWRAEELMENPSALTRKKPGGLCLRAIQ